MRRAKWNVVILAPALALTFLCAQASAVPSPGKQEQTEQAANKETAADLGNYRVAYKVDEIENDKTINSRSYTMMVKTGSTATTRIGSRVPFSTGKDIQYQDVGVNVDCTISKQEGSLVLHSKVSMSSLAGKGLGTSYESNPVFGQFELENVTVVTVGKPAFVGSIDDVTSNRHYEIEVTVTNAK